MFDDAPNPVEPTVEDSEDPNALFSGEQGSESLLPTRQGTGLVGQPPFPQSSPFPPIRPSRSIRRGAYEADDDYDPKEKRRRSGTRGRGRGRRSRGVPRTPRTPSIRTPSTKKRLTEGERLSRETKQYEDEAIEAQRRREVHKSAEKERAELLRMAEAGAEGEKDKELEGESRTRLKETEREDPDKPEADPKATEEELQQRVEELETNQPEEAERQEQQDEVKRRLENAEIEEHKRPEAEPRVVSEELREPAEQTENEQPAERIETDQFKDRLEQENLERKCQKETDIGEPKTPECNHRAAAGNISKTTEQLELSDETLALNLQFQVHQEDEEDELTFRDPGEPVEIGSNDDDRQDNRIRQQRRQAEENPPERQSIQRWVEYEGDTDVPGGSWSSSREVSSSPKDPDNDNNSPSNLETENADQNNLRSHSILGDFDNLNRFYEAPAPTEEMVNSPTTSSVAVPGIQDVEDAAEVPNDLEFHKNRKRHPSHSQLSVSSIGKNQQDVEDPEETEPESEESFELESTEWNFFEPEFSEPEIAEKRSPEKQSSEKQKNFEQLNHEPQSPEPIISESENLEQQSSHPRKPEPESPDKQKNPEQEHPGTSESANKHDEEIDDTAEALQQKESEARPPVLRVSLYKCRQELNSEQLEDAYKAFRWAKNVMENNSSKDFVKELMRASGKTEPEFDLALRNFLGDNPPTDNPLLRNTAQCLWWSTVDQKWTANLEDSILVDRLPWRQNIVIFPAWSKLKEKTSTSQLSSGYSSNSLKCRSAPPSKTSKTSSVSAKFDRELDPSHSAPARPQSVASENIADSHERRLFLSVDVVKPPSESCDSNMPDVKENPSLLRALIGNDFIEHSEDAGTPREERFVTSAVSPAKPAYDASEVANTSRNTMPTIISKESRSLHSSSAKFSESKPPGTSPAKSAQSPMKRPQSFKDAEPDATQSVLKKSKDAISLSPNNVAVVESKTPFSTSPLKRPRENLEDVESTIKRRDVPSGDNTPPGPSSSCPEPKTLFPVLNPKKSTFVENEPELSILSTSRAPTEDSKFTSPPVLRTLVGDSKLSWPSNSNAFHDDSTPPSPPPVWIPIEDSEFSTPATQRAPEEDTQLSLPSTSRTLHEDFKLPSPSPLWAPPEVFSKLLFEITKTLWSSKEVHDWVYGLQNTVSFRDFPERASQLQDDLRKLQEFIQRNSKNIKLMGICPTGRVNRRIWSRLLDDKNRRKWYPHPWRIQEETRDILWRMESAGDSEDQEQLMSELANLLDSPEEREKVGTWVMPILETLCCILTTKTPANQDRQNSRPSKFETVQIKDEDLKSLLKGLVTLSSMFYNSNDELNEKSSLKEVINLKGFPAAVVLMNQNIFVKMAQIYIKSGFDALFKSEKKIGFKIWSFFNFISEPLSRLLVEYCNTSLKDVEDSRYQMKMILKGEKSTAGICHEALTCWYLKLAETDKLNSIRTYVSKLWKGENVKIRRSSSTKNMERQKESRPSPELNEKEQEERRMILEHLRWRDRRDIVLRLQKPSSSLTPTSSKFSK